MYKESSIMLNSFKHYIIGFLNAVRYCVATLQGQAGSWYLCTWKNIHRAIAMSVMPLFTRGQATACCKHVSICMSHVMAPAPHCSIHCGTCPLVCLSSSFPPAGSPYLFKY